MADLALGGSTAVPWPPVEDWRGGGDEDEEVIGEVTTAPILLHCEAEVKEMAKDEEEREREEQEAEVTKEDEAGRRRDERHTCRATDDCTRSDREKAEVIAGECKRGNSGQMQWSV